MASTSPSGPAGANNAIQATGQTVTLPSGSYAAVELLATAVNGNQTNQTFTVNYTDGSSQTFSQSMSDWHASESYAGESVAVTSAYRNTSNGGQLAGTFNVYGYSLVVDSTKTIASITLPNDKNVVVLSIQTVAPLDAPTNLTVSARFGHSSQFVLDRSHDRYGHRLRRLSRHDAGRGIGNAPQQFADHLHELY